MEKTLKHLEMIQGVINRLASNSFHIKGWSVVLVSALFALAAGNANTSFIALSFFPAIVFWGLDGYFLWEERKFKQLYDRVRKINEDEIDFSMNTETVKASAGSWLTATFSTTLIPFHGAIVLAIVIVKFQTI